MALAPAFAALQVPVDQAQIMQFASTKPTLQAVKDFSKTFLSAHGKSTEVIDDYLKTVDSLLGGHGKMEEGTVMIGDRNEWRKAQIPGPHSIPVAEYSDLFPAKL